MIAVLLVQIQNLVFPSPIIKPGNRFAATQKHQLFGVGFAEGTEPNVVGHDIDNVFVIHLVALLGIELRAVAAREFVSVVAIVVMAGGEQDSDVGFDVLAGNGVGHFRIRTGLVEEVNRVVVREKQFRHNAGEIVAANATVVADDNLAERR